MSGELVTLPVLKDAYQIVRDSPFCVRTPLLKNVTPIFDYIDPSVELYLKLENMQKTGSFKDRGLSNQLHHLPADCLSGSRRMVTYSAGNYGKAFAVATSRLGLQGLVVMPDHAPVNRSKLISSFGAEVERRPNSTIMARLQQLREDGFYVAHPFDDPTIIAGYGSIAFEILEEVPSPDVAVTCCGGGGMLAGMAAGFKLAGNNSARVYGAEPETGVHTYAHAAEFVDGIALVSDEDIVRNMFRLYRAGLLVEPSGAAAFAAVAENKLPEDLRGKKVVIIISGGNMTVEELNGYAKQFPHLVLK